MRNRFVCFLITTLVASLPLDSYAGSFKTRTRAEADAIRIRIKAARFLDAATFGATKAEIDVLAQRMGEINHKAAMAEWIDRQFALQPTLIEPTAIQMISDDGLTLTQGDAGVARYRHQAFWHLALSADDQLRHRTAFALSQIVVINDHMFGGRTPDLSGKPNYLAPLNYYDMLVQNSSRTYRDILFDATLHPCMGRFLSHRRNRKADEAGTRFPDENFAREIMQLFSIGLYELKPNGTYQRDEDGNLIPTYTNEEIKAFSRVFTGLTDVPNEFWGLGNSFVPMVMWEREHDTGEKQLLNGTVIPADQPGMQDINDAIDNIASHRNIGPFIGRRLIQRLTKSNPSKGYLSRVSTVFRESGGDMKSVIKAILLDKEFLAAVTFKMIKNGPGDWTLKVIDKGTKGSKFREPMLRYTSFLRKFKVETTNQNGWFMMGDMRWQWTQAFMDSPSVFNFYLPDFQPPGEIVSYRAPKSVPNRFLAAPEFELYTSVTANRTPNRFRRDIFNEQSEHNLFSNSTYTFTSTLPLNFAEEKTLAADPQALVDHLDVLLAHGNLTNKIRRELVAALTEETTDATERTHAAILSVMIAPETAVTR
ncbi:MAG: DUF1800 family protein [Planctomycetaceae bacterium]